jgi:hypothetical protein
MQKELRMIKNWKAALASLVLSISMFGAGAAFTSSAHAQNVPALRGEYRSAQNLLFVRRRLEALIDQLQQDQRDYDGHRVAAVADMQQARAQLDQAIRYDRSHSR